ncbi:MAG: CPBP family intramembrane metalloprotease [Deltaproteobacteria bacterium]|nr:CPBP family intramembrane metalloprotease [Deltaproteobacteria bacterium]
MTDGVERRSPLSGLLEAEALVLEPGQTLSGTPGSRRVYALDRGRLEVRRVDGNGRDVVVGVVEPGQLTGEPGATLQAVERSVLHEVRREVVDGVDQGRQGRHGVLHELVGSLQGQLRAKQQRLVEAATASEPAGTRDAMARFMVYMLVGLAAYAVVVKIVADRHVTLANATVVSGPILLAMLAVGWIFVRRSGLPRHVFGLRWEHAGRDTREALVWTVPILVVLTVGKWALVQWSPAHAGEAVMPVLHRPFVAGPLVADLVYTAFVPLQEFVSRGAVQGSLYVLLQGSSRRRWFWAIVVSNALFAVTHLHLTFAYAAAAFVGGIVWGLLFARQRSLVGPVVSHMVIGFYALHGLGFAAILKGVG